MMHTKINRTGTPKAKPSWTANHNSSI